MGYDVNYASETNRKAVLDLVQYAGFRRSHVLIKAAKNVKIDPQLFAVMCSFAGVRGFPVAAALLRWRGEED